MILSNETLRLQVGFDAGGVPFIEQAEWVDTGRPVFTGEVPPPVKVTWTEPPGLPRPLRHPRDAWRIWVSELLLPWAWLVLPEEPAPVYRVTADTAFKRAEIDATLPGLTVTWAIELAKTGSLFRLHVRLRNDSTEPRTVDWFPAWVAQWNVAGGVEAVRRWKALTFEPVETPLPKRGELRLGSRLHSSDQGPQKDGVNPYWVLQGPKGRLYFGLAWCGGWEATLRREGEVVAFDIRLPEKETELVLQPGESIGGPIVEVVASRETDEMRARADWMRQRAALARLIYGGPEPAYLFTYNHWYSTGWKNAVTAEFLWRQVVAMDPYRFDAFIVDWGWFQNDPEWTPHPDRYKPGEFEAILAKAREKGAIAGVWTEPQKVKGEFVDLASIDFTRRLLEHVAMLRERYGIGWWKYDQALFVEGSRSGVMRNVVAFENALQAVRKAQPDLRIENCQSGGRMINEHTMLWSQSQWLRDGGSNGVAHARDINIPVALGALGFVFPWAGNQWTNKLDEMDPDDDEVMRFYCRSAMAMTWGIGADLPKIGERQRGVVLREAGHYRRLNEMKGDYVYDLWPPREGADTAGVAYYSADGRRAACLVCRWDRAGAFDHMAPLRGLRADVTYRVEDVDSGRRVAIWGEALMKDGLQVPFDARRMSALVFLEAEE